MKPDIVLLVGGSSGIGLACAKDIAQNSPHTTVVIASRSKPGEALPSNIIHQVIDLASQQSVRSFVSSWSYGSISALILNAGLIPGGSPTYNSEGIEVSFAVNHVNSALLFFLLKDRELLERSCHIIFVTTALHDPKQPLNQSPPHWTDPQSVAKADSKQLQSVMVRYSTTKLGTLFFAYALAKRAAASTKNEWRVNCYEPGFVPGTNLSREQSAVLRAASRALLPLMLGFFRKKGIVVSTPSNSGKALADLAMNRTLQDLSGKYILLDHDHRSSDESYDESKQQELWAWTINILAEGEREKESFGAI